MTAEPAAALPQTCCPSIWLWRGHALYAGPSLRLEPHSGSVWCLAVGVDRPLSVTAGSCRIEARSVLIPPRLVHHFDTHGGRLVSCYLDPSSDRATACRDKFAHNTAEFALDHVEESVLAVLPRDDSSARRWLDRAAPPSPRRMDPRITAAVSRMQADPAAAVSSAELAAEAGLSESRFLHLFRAETGTSLRRFRMWARLTRAAVALRNGRNLTDAATEAGFASSSHLADRFKTTFGLTASQLLGSGAVLHLPVE